MKVSSGAARARRASAALLLGLAATASACLAPSAYAQHPEYQRGYREGYDQGFQQGYDRAMHENRPPPPAVVVPVEPPRRGIYVLRAWYGESERRACDLTGWAARRFNGRASQSVAVTNQMCGDPAPGERKELVIEYSCGAEPRRASAYEHRSLSISCY